MKKTIAVACDLEYTCWDPVAGDILSAGLVEIYEDYTLGREIEVLSRPRSSKYFTDGAVAVHGISYYKAMTFPPPIEGCEKIAKWLDPIRKDGPLAFVYHGNGKSDWRWLMTHFDKVQMKDAVEPLFPELKVESTLFMAKRHLAHIQESKKVRFDGKPLGKYTMENVADHYNIPILAHNALSDARACAQVYCNIKNGVDCWTGELF